MPKKYADQLVYHLKSTTLMRFLPAMCIMFNLPQLILQEEKALAEFNESIEGEIESKATFILNKLADQIADPEAIKTVREELSVKAEEEALQAWTESKARVEEETKANYRAGKVLICSHILFCFLVLMRHGSCRSR